MKKFFSLPIVIAGAGLLVLSCSKTITEHTADTGH